MGRFCWRCATPLGAPLPTTCERCGQAHYLNPRPCGEAVVVREGRLLLVQRAAEPEAGAWDVPGGFCDAGEHPMHAAERELCEETGLVGRASAYIGTWMDEYLPEADGTPVHTAVSAYLVELAEAGAGTEVVRPAPGEVADVGWFPVSDLPEPIAFARHTEPMLEALTALLRGDGTVLPDRTW